MEFQAYPSIARKERNIFLKVQNALHSSDSIVLPAILLTVGSCLVVYQHMTDPDTSRHSVRNFLAKILVSMLPLAILERKILQCPDPIALFAKFSPKVMLMHTFFLAMRMARFAFPNIEVGYHFCNMAGVAACCVMLPFIFKVRPTRASFFEHRDVWGLVLFTTFLALIEVSMLGRFAFRNRWTRDMFLEDLVLTGSDYTEILAFVPAAWMACRKDAGQADAQLEDSKKRAICLFAFLVAFYSVEDVANAFSLRKDYPVAACGHVAHFLLLMDFAGFLLAHLYDPDKFAKVRSAFLGWVVDACAV